jgi:hypothetical protein
MSTLDKVSIGEDAQDEHLSAFPENQRKSGAPAMAGVSCDDGARKEGAHREHVPKMSTFLSSSFDVADLDPRDRADVEDIAEELRRGGAEAVASWRADLARRNGGVSERDRQLVELAIRLSEQEKTA